MKLKSSNAKCNSKHINVNFDTDRRMYCLDPFDDLRWTMGWSLYLPWRPFAWRVDRASNCCAQTCCRKWPSVVHPRLPDWRSRPAIEFGSVGNQATITIVSSKRSNKFSESIYLDSTRAENALSSAFD